MSAEQQQLEAGIRALEAQRAVLGDAVVDASVAGLRAKLAALAAPGAPPPEPAQALKQVSILFLDVVGSTSLSQHLDPEAVSEVFDGAMARCARVIEHHGGKVMQYAGDSVMAVFGALERREDDTERAVKCGLALLALGQALGAEVLAAHGHDGFNVRVGIHTGGVVLGGGVDDDRTVRGIAVSIAARMEQSAPTGALRISHDTYAQVRGMFEVDAQSPLTVKGVDAPLQTYLVLRAKPRQFRIATRGIEGVATRMIGRDAELGALQAAYHRLFEERRLAAVSVVAEAGIGKSRLLYEFEAWSEARSESFFLFRGRATPATGTQAYGLLRDVIAWRFQIQDDDSIEATRKKMEEGIVPLFLHDDGPDLAEGHAHLLGHLIGIDWKDSRHIRGILDDPRQIRNRAFHAAAQMFRRVSATDNSPVILQLEDLHWSDSESLDFLTYLAQVNRDVPLLMLSFTRPTFFERRTDWSGSDGLHARIDLHPLDKDMSRMLANELLQKLPEIPAALRELLTSSAEGNPFYMEELVKMLIDQGAIRTDGEDDAWKVDAERLLVTQVPSTLTGVLQARLDGLPDAERRALQQASVVGAVFWNQALAAVDAQAAEQLPALVRRELTLPRADAQIARDVEGLHEYAFRHQVLHQVTYDTVLKRHKREGHARVAHWLASLTAQGQLRAGDSLGLVAEHFQRAGDGLNAAEFHARAAEHAGQRMAHDRVLAHVVQALALLDDAHTASSAAAAQTELRWRLVSAREKTLHILARREEQATDLDVLEQLADALDDDRRRADVALRRGLRGMRMADWTAQQRAARLCMDCAARTGDDAKRLHALWLLAWAEVQQGHIGAGQALAQKGLDEARRLGLRSIEARLLNTLAAATEMQFNLVGVLDLHRQSLQAFSEVGDRVNEAIGKGNLGIGWLNFGDLVRARRDLDEGLQLLQANGDRAMEGALLAHLSVLALWQGQEARALALARQALDICLAAQARDQAALNAMRLGDAELALGRRAEARRAYAQAHAEAIELGILRVHDASAGLARVALDEGDSSSALAAVQPLLNHVAAGHTLDGTDYPRLIELTCYQTLARAGDPRATDWLVRAHTALMAQADAISQHSPDPALRLGFLNHIPYHREIVAAWARRRAVSAPSD